MRYRYLACCCQLSVLLAGCTATDLASPIAETTEMQVLFLLNPSRATQVVLVEAVDVGGTLSDVNVVISTPDAREVAAGDGTGDASPCVARYGVVVSVNDTDCVLLHFSPGMGATYHVEISARDRPTATASVVIPGDFSITHFRADGDPPGSQSLSATWETSRDSYRYAVAIASEAPADCIDVRGCEESGWSEIVADTTFSDRIPEGTIDQSRDWYFDVYALSKGLHDFITTGAGGDVFPIPPSQNVHNGFGMVGAWVRKSRPLSSGS